MYILTYKHSYKHIIHILNRTSSGSEKYIDGVDRNPTLPP